MPRAEGELQLLRHVSMFGSEGYPIQKLAGRWTWGTDAVKGPPVMFKRKRDAVESFEAWLDAQRRALGEEVQARAIEDLRMRGHSEGEIRQMVASARGTER